jgi:hypothetical protein
MSNGTIVGLAAKIPPSADPVVQQFQKLLESAETAETVSPTKSLKYYKRSLKEFNKSGSVQDVNFDFILKEIKTRVSVLEEKVAQEKSVEVLELSNSSTLKRRSSKSQSSVPPRVRKASQGGTPSGSTTSITASTSEGAPNMASKGQSKKKTKRVGVRFQEQKRFYFYEEDASPDVTSKIASGFTSIPGVNDAKFDPLLKELIRIALVPVTTSHTPFPESDILEYIQSAFSVSDKDWRALMKEERANWDIYALITSLIARVNTIHQHPFYTPQTFRSDEDALAWQAMESKRLMRLINRLKELAPDYDERCAPASNRKSPARSKSRSGIDDSTSTNASSSGRLGRTSSSSKVISAKKARRKDTGMHLSVAASPSGDSAMDSDDSEVLPVSSRQAAQAAEAMVPEPASPRSSKKAVAKSKKKSSSKLPVSAPSPPPPAAAAAAAAGDADTDDSKDDTTSESVSGDIPAWSRGPRVAIRPLQFVADSSEEGAGHGTDQAHTPAGSARRPLEGHDSDSGSDPASPRGDLSDDSVHSSNAIMVSRKPRSSTPGNISPLGDKYNKERGSSDEDEGAEFAEKPDADGSSEESREVSMAPTSFEILYRTLTHHELLDLRKQEKRIEQIIPLLDRAHEAISSQFSLDRHVNMFDALPELNPDAFVSGFSGNNFFLSQIDTTEPNPDAAPLSLNSKSSPIVTPASSKKPSKKKSTRDKNDLLASSVATDAPQVHPWKVPLWEVASEMEKVLFGMSPIASWLLGEYAILWGYSPLYQNLVQLNHVVSFLMPCADHLLMLYVLMTRVLDLLQAEELEPIPSALETYYFAQVMRDLNRDAESAFYNMFGQFSYEDLAALKMLLNILSLIYECNEYLGEAPPKTYKAYLEQALEESVRNYYTEVVTDAEEPREMSGDPVGTNPSSAVRKRQRSERRTTANQLLAACDAMEDLLTNLRPFQELFAGLSKPLFDICCKAYIRQLFSDTSLFVIKMARTQPVSQALALANGIIKINELCKEHSRSEVIEPLPVEKLFGAFLYDWLVQTELTMKEWVNTTCKIERWAPADAAKGKMWSACSWDLYKLVLSHIPFVFDNETLFQLTLVAEATEMQEGGAPASWHLINSSPDTNKMGSVSGRSNHKAIGYTAESLQERKKTYFYQYSLGVSRVLRDFVENVYNLFVEEFPTDLHSDLHDLYIRDYYNMTTGGSGLHLMYKKKKKSIFAWLTGKKSSKNDTVDDASRHAHLASSSSQPRIGKKKSTAALGSSSITKTASASDLSTPRSNSTADSDEDVTSGFKKSDAGVGVMNGYQSAGIEHNDDPNRELIINVWSMIVFDPKKAIKIRKLRKRIDIKQSMCTKLNDLDALRAFFDKLLSNEPLFQMAANPAFVLMHKVFRTFLHMIIYIINMHLDTELEHIYKKCGKKPSSSVFESHQHFISNITDQLALMRDNLRNNIFKRILLRIWKVVQEDIAELLATEDEDGKSRSAPNAMQIAALEALLDALKPILSGHGMSSNHINAKVEELLGEHRTALGSDLDKARAIYEAERDKFFHKEKKKLSSSSSSNVMAGNATASPTIRNSASSPALATSSSESSRKLHHRESSKDMAKEGAEIKPKRAASKDGLKDTSESGSRSHRASSSAPSRRGMTKDGSNTSLSASTLPSPPASTASATTSTASQRRPSEARRELNHQESASAFVREEQPLTESSEEADAYANIKVAIAAHGSDSISDSQTAETPESSEDQPSEEEKKPTKKKAGSSKDSTARAK